MKLYRTQNHSVAAALAASDPRTWNPKERANLQKIANGIVAGTEEPIYKKQMGFASVLFKVQGYRFIFNTTDKGVQVGRYWGE